MAAISAMPQLEKDIIRKACSDPSFVAMIYLIIKLSGNESLIPPPTVIGGAAFMLHAYVLNGRNKVRMQEAIRAVPQTSDIDIAIWYTNVKDKDTFLSKNNTMVDKIRENLTKKEGQFTNILLEQLRRLLPDPSIIDTFSIQVTKEEPKDKRFEHMTTKININFIINGKSIPVVDISIKNVAPLILEHFRIKYGCLLIACVTSSSYPLNSIESPSYFQLKCAILKYKSIRLIYFNFF